MSKRKQTNRKPNGVAKNNLNLLHVSPLTDNQATFFDSVTLESNHMLLGAAGTGKTFMALYQAFIAIQNSEQERLIIFRSTVASRDQGFLPGTAKEKAAPYESTYRANVNALFKRDDAYELLVKQGIIQFRSSSFERGTTIDDSVVLIDEVQNMTANELDTLVTRTGTNTRLFLCGDLMQQDLTKHSEKNVYKALAVLEGMSSMKTIHFTIEDIVRSGFTKEYLTKKQTIYKDGY